MILSVGEQVRLGRRRTIRIEHLHTTKMTAADTLTNKPLGGMSLFAQQHALRNILNTSPPDPTDLETYSTVPPTFLASLLMSYYYRPLDQLLL